VFYSISLYIALAACAAALVYKVYSWLHIEIGAPSHQSSTFGERVLRAAIGVLKTAFSPKIIVIAKAFILDALLQRRSLKNSFWGWFTHILLFWGFILLVLMHALESLISVNLFSDYASTLNPYLFLRNVFGVMVLAGVGLAIYRRVTIPGMRLTNRSMDRIAIAILAVIILSGFALEAVKIGSQRSFDQMVEEYTTSESEEEIKALKYYWAREFSVAFPKGEADEFPDAWEQGLEVHENNCAGCHSKPQWAFASFGLAKTLSPAALALSEMDAQNWLWHIHFLAVWLVLALFPLTKFFHLLTSPLILMINAACKRQDLHPANLLTLRALELDACTHCATCSIHCSVAVALREVPNLNILPSEKLAALKKMAYTRTPNGQKLDQVRQGSDICTSCYRCTRLCPVGIDLQDLWLAMKDDLQRRGYGETYDKVKDSVKGFTAAFRQEASLGLPLSLAGREGLPQLQAGAQSTCFNCVTCTNSCPIVFQFDNPEEHLDLLPHQIMYAMRLGLQQEVMGARMVWSCLTCYRCQEACPQGVPVTDMLYELRGHAARLNLAQSE
jgi:heterodisulfide reductase subunit C/nitrate reductase gamma subunit